MNNSGYNCWCWSGEQNNNCGCKNSSHKFYCECEKENPKYNCFEKDFSKCGCAQDKFQYKNFDYGFNNKSKYENSCGCGNNNYGYDKYDQKNFGWY